MASEQELALFLDFEVAGYRVIIFPSTVKATLVGHPEPVETLASMHWQDNPLPFYTTGRLVENERVRLSRHLAEYLENRTLE